MSVRLAGLSWRKNYSDWDPAAQTAGSPGQTENRQIEREKTGTEAGEGGQEIRTQAGAGRGARQCFHSRAAPAGNLLNPVWSRFAERWNPSRTGAAEMLD